MPNLKYCTKCGEELNYDKLCDFCEGVNNSRNNPGAASTVITLLMVIVLPLVFIVSFIILLFYYSPAPSPFIVIGPPEPETGPIGSIEVVTPAGKDDKQIQKEIEIQPQKLNPEVEKQLGDIIKFVMQTVDEPSMETRAKFWSIAKDGNVTDKNIADTRDIIAGPLVDYMKLFYEDALLSVKQRTPIRSTERNDYENHLLNIGAMTKERYDKNQKTMENIAYGLPNATPRGEITFSENIIIQSINNIDLIYNRINLLLKP